MRARLTFALVALTAGCGTQEAVIDTSGVPVTALYDTPYSGQFAIVDYDGDVEFQLVGGALPDGLELSDSGSISGTPEWIATSTFDVRASDMEGRDDAIATVTMTVGPNDDVVANGFLGILHDQLNNFHEETSWAHPFGYMIEPWVRVRGGGIPDMSDYTIQPRLYLPGPDGVNDGGFRDDIMVGEVPRGEITWNAGAFEATEGVSPDQPPDKVHTPDGDPTVVASGVVAAGSDAGKLSLELNHPTYGTHATEVNVVPPDWCARGYHPVGGYTEGCCLAEDCDPDFLPEGW